MGKYKQFLLEYCQDPEPSPADFKTKKEMNEYFKPKKSKAADSGNRSGNDFSVPMSKKRLFDNAEDWLDDEPWRKW